LSKPPISLWCSSSFSRKEISSCDILRLNDLPSPPSSLLAKPLIGRDLLRATFEDREPLAAGEPTVACRKTKGSTERVHSVRICICQHTLDLHDEVPKSSPWYSFNATFFLQQFFSSSFSCSSSYSK
jgi:hypothetical protein